MIPGFKTYHEHILCLMYGVFRLTPFRATSIRVSNFLYRVSQRLSLYLLILLRGQIDKCRWTHRSRLGTATSPQEQAKRMPVECNKFEPVSSETYLMLPSFSQQRNRIQVFPVNLTPLSWAVFRMEVLDTSRPGDFAIHHASIAKLKAEIFMIFLF